MSNNKIISNAFGKTIIGSSLPIDVRGDLTKNYSIVSSESHLILSSSVGSYVTVSGNLNVVSGAATGSFSGIFSGSLSGSVDISSGRLSNINASGTFSGSLSGSVNVNGGIVNNSLGHLILSSSLGSFVQISASLKLSGSGHAITGTLSLLDGISASYYDARNTTSNYHFRAVSSHLILSSSAGSIITVSGSLKVSGSTSITGSLSTNDGLSASVLAFPLDAVSTHVRAVNSRLILSSSAGSVVYVSGSLIASGSKHTITGTLSLINNAEILRIGGADSAYVTFYPQGAATRYGYLGFGTSNGETLGLVNEAAALGHIHISPGAGGFLGVGSGVSVPSYMLDVYTNAAGAFAANFVNTGNNANRHGIRIICGANNGVGQTFVMDVGDGDQTEIGYIEQTAAGVFQLVDVSDPRLKTGIAPTQVKGLDTLNALNLIEYRFIRHGPTGGLNRIGFDADNCETVFPTMTSIGPCGTKGTARAALIPVLVKAIQELSSRIEALESGSLI